MTTSDLNGIIVGALIAIFGASLLSIFRYWVTNRVESKQWEREQRAQEIERIDNAAAELTQHAAILMTDAYSGTSEFNKAQSDVRASFARWDILVNHYCTEEERKKIQNQLDFLQSQKFYPAVPVNSAVIEITHAVKERLISDDERPLWKFWGN